VARERETERERERLMDVDAVLRMVRFPGIPPVVQFFLTSFAAMIVLALLDFIGAVFAKEWADTRQPWWFVAGLVTFIGLFAFYAASLKTAELSIVTIGWVVLLQVGLLIYERVRYGAELPPLKWVAIALILALQTYLVLVPNESSSSDVVAESTGGDPQARVVSEMQQ
jgi:multidrug transporter EmrE-like cation transporter